MEILAYTSEASESVDGSDVFAIVAVAARNNSEKELTGILLFNGGQFLQLLEGSSDSIDSLMMKLRRDNRHSNIQVLDRVPIKVRQFSEWSMKRLVNSSSKDEIKAVTAKLDGLNMLDEFEVYISNFLDQIEISKQEAA